MKDLPMFNKLFVVLYSSLVICSSFAATADEYKKTWTTLAPAEVVYNVGGMITTDKSKVPFLEMVTCGGETRCTKVQVLRVARKFYGTKSQLRAAQEKLEDNNLESARITKAEDALDKKRAQISKEKRDSGAYTITQKQANALKPFLEELDRAIRYAKDDMITTLHSGSIAQKNADDAAAKKLEDERLATIAAAKKKAEDDAAAQKIEDERLAKIAADKVIEDARLAKIAAAKKKAEDDAAAKKIEDERLAKIAADKVIEDARLAKIAAAKKIEDARLAKIAAEKEEKRLAKIAADKVIEDARLAKIAADKVIEDARLAKIAAAKKIEDARLAKIAADKEKEEKRLAKIKIAQDLAADKARALREYKKNKAINVASIALSLLEEFNNGPKDPNIIKSITKDGIVRTLRCNPGPCTSGSVKLHENITGVKMGVAVNSLAKRIRSNSAQRKPKDNTNKNNTETAEASLEDVSLDTMFEDVEADFDATNDTNLARALSIPIEQVEKNKKVYTKLIESSHDNEDMKLVNPLQGVGDEVPWWLK